jgi:hypothetical protein
LAENGKKLVSIFVQLRKSLDCRDYRLEFDNHRILTYKTVCQKMRVSCYELTTYLSDFPNGNLTVYANKLTKELVIKLVRWEA